MFRASLIAYLFSKPVTQGYVAQLPKAVPAAPGRAWMRAMDANSDVRDFFSPDAERYDAWYRETYGIEDLSDGSAASGAASNRLLDDTRNLQQAAEEYDLRGVEEEMQFWGEEFQHNTQLQWVNFFGPVRRFSFIVHAVTAFFFFTSLFGFWLSFPIDVVSLLTDAQLFIVFFFFLLFSTPYIIAFDAVQNMNEWKISFAACELLTSFHAFGCATTCSMCVF